MLYQIIGDLPFIAYLIKQELIIKTIHYKIVV